MKKILLFMVLSGLLYGCTSSKPSYEGIYWNSNWNGREATLILDENGGCKYPTTPNCEYWVEDDSIKLKLYGSDNDIHEAYVVDGGLILHDHFFEKKK